MSPETASSSPQSWPEHLRSTKSLEEMIVEQGVAETATFEHLLGSGADLWADDAEFDAFLQHLRDPRE